MNKKEGKNLAAVIDIGSNLIKMRVTELQNGDFFDLELLEYPIGLGHEVFHFEKVSFEMLGEISSTLKGYLQILSEYGITQYKIVATTALREAKNCAFIVDQLKIQNDVIVEVLEDNEENTLIYSEIMRNMVKQTHTEIDLAILSYIGTGGIGVALYHNGAIVTSQNIPMGSLKLYDILGFMQDQTSDFHVVLDEYIDSIIEKIHLPYMGKTIDTLLVTGKEMEIIAEICDVPLEQGNYVIPEQLIKELYRRIQNMTPEVIAGSYHLSYDQAKILYTSLSIYTRILKLTSAKEVVSPKIELWDAIIRQLIFPKSFAGYDAHVKTGAISCAISLAERYDCDKHHFMIVKEYAGSIFDRLKKIHGLSAKKRLVLELASILHECGYYVNAKNYLSSTFGIIRNSNIYGMAHEEILLIAHIARYNEFEVPNYHSTDYMALSQKNKLVVLKLIAILRLADALDKSHKQKIQSVKVKVSNKALVVTGESSENVCLERWAFQECIPFFEEVFGVKPQLVVKPLHF